MTTNDPTKQVPTVAEVAQATAYMAGVAYGFGLLFEEWTGLGDGTATTGGRDGTRLIYTGDELHPFDAVIPCARHTQHRTGVSYPAELDQARTNTAECSARPPTPYPRAVEKPTPLWLITRAADTPGSDRTQSAAS